MRRRAIVSASFFVRLFNLFILCMYNKADSRENKSNCFPRDRTLSEKYHICGVFLLLKCIQIQEGYIAPIVILKYWACFPECIKFTFPFHWIPFCINERHRCIWGDWNQWSSVQTKWVITWRISARVLKEILFKWKWRLHGEGFSPDWISARAENVYSDPGWKAEKPHVIAEKISARVETILVPRATRFNFYRYE